MYKTCVQNVALHPPYSISAIWYTTSISLPLSLMSTASTDTLFSDPTLQQEELGFLREIAASRELEQGTYKKSPEHLVVPESKGRDRSHTALPWWGHNSLMQEYTERTPNGLSWNNLSKKNVILGFDPNYRPNTRNPYWLKTKRTAKLSWINDGDKFPGQKHSKSLL